eukprot:364753-Chlamydomonas_euryale.AAC.10
MPSRCHSRMRTESSIRSALASPPLLPPRPWSPRRRQEIDTGPGSHHHRSRLLELTKPGHGDRTTRQSSRRMRQMRWCRALDARSTEHSAGQEGDPHYGRTSAAALSVAPSAPSLGPEQGGNPHYRRTSAAAP